MLLAAPTQRFTFELLCVVEIEPPRLSCHRPLHLPGQPHRLQPAILVAGHPAQTQPDRYRGRRFERHHETEDTSAEYVDRHGQIRAADRFAVVLVDDHQIHHGVIDLHLLEYRFHRRRDTAGALARPRSILAPTQPGYSSGMHRCDPHCHRIARRHPQS
ncbi:hypothetical protein [Rhodococcus qingshengii]|uniref:hypothetical protein n=1 Tax=Rhodococcus qingshengii TaxID=334542 RepID=UPI003FD7510D